MNDYLAKPITPTTLIAMLDKWTGGSHQTGDHAKGEVPADFRDEFLAQCARDLGRVKELLASRSPGALEELRKVVHNISGSGAMVGCPDLSASAKELDETLRDKGDPKGPDCVEALERLERAVKAV